MDVHKIAEAAAAIKKVEHSDAWFARVARDSALERTIQVNTVGVYTSVSGHSEAIVFLRLAFEQFRNDIVDLAIEMSKQAAREAKAMIQEEASK